MLALTWSDTTTRHGEGSSKSSRTRGWTLADAGMAQARATPTAHAWPATWPAAPIDFHRPGTHRKTIGITSTFDAAQQQSLDVVALQQQEQRQHRQHRDHGAGH